MQSQAHNFAYKNSKSILLNNCFNSPKPQPAVEALTDFFGKEACWGSAVGQEYPKYSNQAIQGAVRNCFARLLGARVENTSIHVSTASAVEFISRHYPFGKHDRVLALEGDYPSLYQPFKNIEGLQLEFLSPLRDGRGAPVAWSLDDLDVKLKQGVSPTAIVAVSEVLYTSGFKVDVPRLSRICRENGAKLLLDVAQSIGVCDLSKHADYADMIVFPAWKGLLCPRSVAGLYTSPELTASLMQRVRHNEAVTTMIDKTGMMDLDAGDARAFQPSTLATNLLLPAKVALEDHSLLKLGVHVVQREVASAQMLLMQLINPEFASPVLSPEDGGGLIVAFRLQRHAGREDQVIRAAAGQGLLLTSRAGLLRLAPHYFNGHDEIVKAAEILNAVLAAD